MGHDDPKLETRARRVHSTGNSKLLELLSTSSYPLTNHLFLSIYLSQTTTEIGNTKLNQIKLDTDESDKRLFQILVEELDRIEVTIDPYSDPDLLEQWTMCIGEIMQSFSSIPGVDSSSRTSSIAGAGAGSPIEGGQGEANEQRAGRDKGTSQSPGECLIIQPHRLLWAKNESRPK